MFVIIWLFNFSTVAYADEENAKDERKIFHQFMAIALPKEQAEMLVFQRAYTSAKIMTEYVEKYATKPLSKEELKPVNVFFIKQYMNKFPYEKQVDFVFDHEGFVFDVKGMKKVIALANTSDGQEILRLINYAQTTGPNIVPNMLDYEVVKIDYSNQEFLKAFPHIQLKE